MIENAAARWRRSAGATRRQARAVRCGRASRRGWRVGRARTPGSTPRTGGRCAGGGLYAYALGLDRRTFEW